MKPIAFACGIGVFLALMPIGWAQEQVKVMNLTAAPPVVQKAIQAQLGTGTIDEIDRVDDRGVITFDVETTTKDGLDRDFTIAQDGSLKSIEIALGDAPAVVQKTIHTEMGTGKLDSIEKVMDDDGTSFDITVILANGKDHDFTVAENGKLESVEISLAETPAAVQKAVKAKIGDGTVDNVEKNFDDDGISYQIGFTTKDGRESSFSLAASGTLESEEVALADTPAPVQATIKKEVGNGKVQDVDKIYDPDGVTYEVGITKAGRYHNFTVAADGHLDSREIPLADAPAAVQATIKAQIGDGKVLRIDRSFVGKDSGVFPFQVTGEKNGKPFDFSVGPGGKFLGLDD